MESERTKADGASSAERRQRHALRSPMKMQRVALATALAFGSHLANHGRALAERPLIPATVDVTHATRESAAFFHSFFTAKSRHDVDAAMSHFSTSRLTYADATLGWAFYTHGALRGVWAEYMPKWPATGLSYPTRILGDERSALVAFTDTPELFGSEIRSFAAVDISDGKIVRWVDYWDGRHFGAERAAKLRTPSDKFPTDFKEATVPGNASPRIRAVANKLHAALAGNDATAAAALFSSDAVYEDMTLRTQILGRGAIERYLGRALEKLPAGTGSSLRHVVGGDMGGGFEWQCAPAYRTTVRGGITAIELDRGGKVSRLTTLWDGAMLPLDEAKALAGLSIE
jgi:ketosteroid isomerase-like protein